MSYKIKGSSEEGVRPMDTAHASEREKWGSMAPFLPRQSDISSMLCRWIPISPLIKSLPIPSRPSAIRSSLSKVKWQRRRWASASAHRAPSSLLVDAAFSDLGRDVATRDVEKAQTKTHEEEKKRLQRYKKAYEREAQVVNEMKALLKANQWQDILSLYQRLGDIEKKSWDIGGLVLVAMRKLKQEKEAKSLADWLLLRLLNTPGPIKTRTGAARFAFQLGIVFEEAKDVESLTKLVAVLEKKGIHCEDLKRMLLSLNGQVDDDTYALKVKEALKNNPNLATNDEVMAEALKRAIQKKDANLASFLIQQAELHRTLLGPLALTAALFACRKRLLTIHWGQKQVQQYVSTIVLDESSHLLVLAFISFIQQHPAEDADAYQAFALWTRFREVIQDKKMNEKDGRVLADTFGALIAMAYSIRHYELAFLFYYDSVQYIGVNDEVIDTLLSPHEASESEAWPVAHYFARHLLADSLVPLTDPPRLLPRLNPTLLAPRAIVTIVRALAKAGEWEAFALLLPLLRTLLPSLPLRPTPCACILSALIAHLSSASSTDDHRIRSREAGQMRRAILQLTLSDPLPLSLSLQFQDLLEISVPVIRSNTQHAVSSTS